MQDILKYIQKNKTDFEISKFEGDNFWHDDMMFYKLAVHLKAVFLICYPKGSKSHFIILNLKSLRPKAEEMYLKYKKNPENLKKDFYAIQAKMFSSFRILIKNQWYTNLYSNFVKNSQNFSNFSVFAFEGLEALLLRIIRSKINEEKSNALLFPLYSSFASRQNMDLINIIRSLPPAEISLLKKELSDLKCYPVFNDLFKKHRTNWGWAFTNYGSEDFPALK